MIRKTILGRPPRVLEISKVGMVLKYYNLLILDTLQFRCYNGTLSLCKSVSRSIPNKRGKECNETS